MFRNLLKKKNLQPKLGRWAVTYEPKVLDKRINWANHDNCGSEICEKHFVKEKEKKKKMMGNRVKDNLLAQLKLKGTSQEKENLLNVNLKRMNR